MKKEVNIRKKTTTYTIESPTNAGVDIAHAILEAMAKHNVSPEDVLATLADGVSRFLVPIADAIGYEKQEIVNVFGKGLANAQVQICEQSGN